MSSPISPIGHSTSGSVSNDLESRPNLLLSQASHGHEDAFEELRNGADQLAPRDAMGLLHRIAHPNAGDPLATPDPQSTWTSDQQKELVSVLQNRSRQEPAQHLDGYLSELAKIPGDKQTTSDEFSELKRSINRLPTPEARGYLSGFNSDAHPQLDPDAFRQLKEAMQNRAGVRVTRSTGEPEELENFGDLGPNHNFRQADPNGAGNKLDHNDLQGNDAYNAMGSSLSVPYGDGRKLFERAGYRNVPSLQADGDTFEGKTKVFERGIRAFSGMGSSIDPANLEMASGSFNAGAQGEANLVHCTYEVKCEPKALSIGGQEVLNAEFKGSVDACVGSNGDVRASFSAGEYPAIQIQGSAFVGARSESQGTMKVNSFGLDGEVSVKISAAVGAEAAGTMSFGRVNDSIEGQSITTGAEFGGMAFAGLRTGAEVGGELAGASGKVKLETWAGAGVLAKLYAKSESGTISFGGEHGVALGVGGSVSWGVSVNPGKVAKTISEDLPGKIDAAVAAAPGVASRKVVSAAAATRDTLMIAGSKGARVAGKVAANAASAVDAGKQNAAAVLRSGKNAVSTQARAIDTSVRGGVRSGARVAGRVAANTIAGVDGGVRKANAVLRSGATAVSTRAQGLVDNGRQFNADLRARIAQGSHKPAPASSPSQAAEPPDASKLTSINESEVG